MVSALIPQLSIRTSLDSDLDAAGSSRSNLFPSLPSLDFSDDLLSPEEDILEVITPPSASTSALVTGTPRVRVPTPRHALGPRLQAELAHSASSLNVADSTFHPLFLTMSDISSMIFVIDTPPRGSKLIKVLGQDAPKYYLENLNADSKPWYLRLDYSPSDIMADPDGSVRAGTTKALVQKLTCHEHPGTTSSFILTSIFLMVFWYVSK